MTVIKPSLFEKFFTSRKFLLALFAFLIPGLGGLLGYVHEPDNAKTLGVAAPIVYMVIQGAIDWIKTKKVYEAQAAAASATGILPPVVGAPTTDVSAPKTALTAPDPAAPGS